MIGRIPAPDLLVAKCYGPPDIEAIQVGGPGDAGIDGDVLATRISKSVGPTTTVIHLDRLGLEKVYVQA